MFNTRHLKFLCENCYAVQPGEMKLIHSTIGKNVDDCTRIDSCGNLSLHGWCDHCNRDSFFFSVDWYMANIVSKLNNIGLVTEYSCQGHCLSQYEYNDDLESIHLAYKYVNPYIVFRGKKTKKLLECFRKAKFDHIYVNATGQEYKKGLIPLKEWTDSQFQVSMYLDPEYITLKCKEFAKPYDGKKKSNKILNDFSDKVDMFFMEACLNLEHELEKAFPSTKK